MEEEVKYCKNCKRNINAKNYVIHSVHCERKIQLCDRCLEPVPHSDLEKHETEFHLKEICSECGISVEKWQMRNHKETCVRRLVPCEYCELEVPVECLSEHNVACGSRTEPCTKCKKYVMIKDMEIHHTNCSRRDTCTRKLVCEYCKLEIPISIHLEHSVACGSRTEPCTKCKKYVVIKDMEIHHTNCSRRDTCTRKLVSCEYCELEIPISIHLEHSAACGSRTEQCTKCKKYVMIKDMEKHHIKCLRRDLEAVPCEYCSFQIDWNEMMEHTSMCGARTERCISCNKRIMVKDRDTHFITCGKKKQLRVEIPCQYCGEVFPSDFVEDHATICGTRSQKCEKCNKYILLKNIETHSSVCKENMSKAHGNCPVCHQSVPLIEMNDHSIYCAEIYYETSDFYSALKKEVEEYASENTAEKSPRKHLVENVEICPSCKYRIPEQKYHEHLLLCFNGTTQCHICGIDVPRNYEHIHFQDYHKIL